MMNTKKIEETKARLKEEAEIQKKVKYARKQISELEFEKIKKLVAPDAEYWSPQWDVIRRKAVVTALLNYYHWLRGSEHRHKVGVEYEWVYPKIWKEIAGDIAA